jgi:ATP-dependent Lon protease
MELFGVVSILGCAKTLLVCDKWSVDMQPPKFDGKEAAERVATPGVAVGLVWTIVGGEVQFVEASTMLGKGDLHLTGQLGDVIKESAQIALTWVRQSKL